MHRASKGFNRKAFTCSFGMYVLYPLYTGYNIENAVSLDDQYSELT